MALKLNETVVSSDPIATLKSEVGRFLAITPGGEAMIFDAREGGSLVSGFSPSAGPAQWSITKIADLSPAASAAPTALA